MPARSVVSRRLAVGAAAAFVLLLSGVLVSAGLIARTGAPAHAVPAAADPPPGTVVVNENFDGQTTLPAGFIDGGGDWSVGNGVLSQTSTTAPLSLLLFGQHLDNFQLEADLTVTGTEDDSEVAFAIDTPTGTLTSFLGFGVRRNTDLSNGVAVNINGSDVIQNPASLGLADGSTVHVEIDVHGTQGVMLLNGHQVISDASLPRLSTGVFGLAMSAGTTATFDNLTVTTLEPFGAFSTNTVTTAPASLGDTVQQSVAALWGPTTPTGFTKVSGADWLSVSPDGVVSGTVPDDAAASVAPSSPSGPFGSIVVQATDGTTTGTISVLVPITLPSGRFVTAEFTTPAVPAGGAVHQVVSGLWDGTAVPGYTKVSGDSWLSVTPDGTVTGTAPARAPADPGLITVTNGSGSQLSVEVPVLARGAVPQLTAASWNLDDDGSQVSDGLGKELAAITGSGLDVIGLQETDGAGAQALADALGWHAYQSSGDLGIVSAYPISAVTAPTTATPAAGVTVNVDGQSVRVWVAHLDSADFGPDRAAAGDTDLVAHEKTTVRYAQATAIAQEIGPDLANSRRVPVILLGDLESPSGRDGSVDWPVPDVFARAGLTDSLRAVYPRASQDPADTFDLLASGGASNRVDYVDYAGPIQPVDAEALFRGTPQSDTTTDLWPSDHAAAVTLFQLKN